MSLKGRFRNLAAAFLMVLSTVAPMGGALTRSVYAADGDPDLGTPEHSKTLTPNGDGTYTITLSVTGKAESTTVNNGANVVVVLDTSGSMSYYLESNTGRYGTTNPDRPASAKNSTYHTNLTLYSDNRCRNEIRDNVTGGTVYHDNNGWSSCSVYSGQRYDSSKTRLDSAKSSLSSLFTTLLGNNSTEHPTLVEISLISFADTANLRNSWTTNGTVLNNTLNNSDLINADGATNWDDALRLAKTTLDGKNDGDKGYVIFMTDGNPTYYHGCQGRTGCTGSDTNENTVTTSYNNAAPQALAITNAGYNLYDLGVYGSVDRMQNLTAHANTATAANHGDAYYYAAQNETAVNAAFAEIANSITNNLSLTNIKYSDGITGMTTMAVNGTAGNFQYTLGGVATTDPQIATAKFENGEVVWDMGNYVLENGVTATVSFTVWPSQEAYDLVADLNNGKKAYSSLTEEEKKSVSCTLNDEGAVVSCGLKTNTDYPELQYRTVKNSTDGSDPVYGKLQKVSLANPKPVDLVSKKLDIVKLWEDELDPDQQEDYCNKDTKECSVVLKLMRGSEVYEDNIVVKKNGNEWKADKQIAIAPGIMISADSKTGKIVNTGEYPVVDGYVILEEGHDYELQEYDITDHYYLTHYQYHPMLVDGVVKNVIFEYSGNKIVSIIEMNELSQISATNTLKGGFEVTKTVSGKADTKDQKFTIKTLFGDNIAHTYRIYYGENNPCYESTEAGCVHEKGNAGRSVKTTVAGTVTLDIYAGDTIRFQDIDTGTKFKVEEVTDGLPLGYSLEGIEYTVKHGDGEYGAYDQDKIDGDWYIVQPNASARATVKNVYDATTLKISKTIDVTHGDRDAIKAKTFDFKVTLKDGDEELAGEYSYTTNKNNSGKIVSGGTITLGDGEIATIADLPVGAGYIVEEQGANDNGFTTTVSGEESGTLAKAGATVAYTNTYSATPTSTQIIALKSFNDWTSDDVFYFTLKENGNQIGTPVPVSLETNKQAVFNVNYDEPGTYTYTIEESTNGFGDRNITSTPNVLTVTVVVVDNEDGTLSIAQGYPMFTGDGENNNTITNTYESTGSLQLYASKILTGRDWKEGDVFTFQLFAKDGETETQLGENVTIDYAHRNDSVAFSTIDYSTGDSGTRVYVIREVTDNLPAGVTAQMGEVTINVTLTDNHNGSITTNFDADEYTAQLTNVYGTTPTDPAEAVLKVKKTITDLTNSKKDGTFTFQLQNKDGSKVQEKEFTTENLTGEASFNGISFDEAGTYEYKIVEIAGTEAGFTYDETVHNVVIVVKDNTDAAKLYVDSIKIDGNAGTTAEFTNVYEADASDAKVKFDIAKTLTGFEGETPATFTFNMKGDDTDTQTIKGSGTASFKELTYDKAGKHTYTISEQKDDAPGYSYDQTVYTVTVDVVDENAKLVPKVEIKKGEEVVREIKFENTYSASGKASLQITKAFDGDERDWSKESFEFELTGDGIDGAMTATANADSKWVAAFDEITYNKAGKYKYTITEKDSGLAGVTASDPVEVTVSVVDNGNGTLTATPEYTKDATITNTYDTASVDVSLVVRKMIENQSGSTVDGTFTFELSGEGYNDTVEVTTRGGVGGSNTFKTITYDKVGEYRYTLTEKNDGKPGFTYDEKQYEVVVTITDDVENAQLKAKVVMNNEENNGITITNVYKAEPVSVQFDVTKTLNGMNDGIEPVEFEFKLTGDGIEEQTVKIKGAGSESFKEITFDKVGTYHFEIVEVDGKAAGYIYDLAKFIIEVSVKDENGKLVADVAITKDGESASSVNFVNSYEAKPVEDYQIGVVKELEGRELKEGEFSFTLYDADGNEVETTLNDADGIVTFSGLTFDKPGTYVFTVKENIDENKGDIEYDTNEYTITIVVKDDGEGSLYVESDDSTEVVFNNKWNEPGHGEDLPPSPNTEDDIVNSIALFSMSVIGLIGAIIFGKRKAAEEE